MDVEVSIELNKEFLDKTQKQSEADYYESVLEAGMDDPETLKGGRKWDDLNLSDVDWEIDDDFLTFWGSVEGGWVNVKLSIPTELNTKLIEDSIKKLNKLKTVLEAVK